MVEVNASSASKFLTMIEIVYSSSSSFYKAKLTKLTPYILKYNKYNNNSCDHTFTFYFHLSDLDLINFTTESL